KLPMTDFVYKFNHEGFFGFSLTKDFHEFSFAHFAPIILLCLALYFTYRYREKIARWKGEETLRFVLAAIIIINECAYWWRLMYVGNGNNGKQLLTKIPLEVCQWSAFLVSFMIMKKSKHLYDITFYICLSLGVIPLFTPAVISSTGPRYWRYYQFWIEHLLPIYCVLYVTFVHGFRPNWRKVYKPLLLLGCMAVLAIIANLNIPNANFMYLASGTTGDSIANILPENIWVRLALYAVILSVLFALISLPQIIGEIKKKRALSAKIPESEDRIEE
ncbi:MAG: TIGR02206 family membrane protein, partial [Clostridia bacterium]|nr:TIGR02206 family membrane protein [Clostridia bacterium]